MGLDVLFHDLEGSAAAGDSTVAGRPEVRTPESPTDFGEVLFADHACRDAFEAVREGADRNFRRVGDEEVGVVVVGLEGQEFAFEVGTDFAHRVFQDGMDTVSDHTAAILGDE